MFDLEPGSEGAQRAPTPTFRYDVCETTRAASRLSVWQDVLNCYYYPLEMRSSGPRFQVGRIELYDLAAARIGVIESDPMTIEIRRTHITRSDDDYVMLPMTASHELGLQERGRECSIRPGDVAFIATGSPYTYLQPERTLITALRLPAHDVREAIPYIDDLTARRFDREAPAVRLFTDFLQSIIRNGNGIEESHAALLRRSLIDLLALAITAPYARPLDETSTRLAHRQRILRFIDTNVCDAALSTAHVCKVFGLSERYVQKLFAEREETLTEIIRQRKMTQARRMLRDIRLQGRSMEEISYSLGYTDPAYFSRLFKRETGMSPSEFRKGAIRAP